MLFGGLVGLVVGLNSVVKSTGVVKLDLCKGLVPGRKMPVPRLLQPLRECRVRHYKAIPSYCIPLISNEPLQSPIRLAAVNEDKQHAKQRAKRWVADVCKHTFRSTRRTPWQLVYLGLYCSKAEGSPHHRSNRRCSLIIICNAI